MTNWDMLELESTVTILRAICDAVEESNAEFDEVNLDQLGYGSIPVSQLNKCFLEAVGPHSLEHESICGTSLNLQVLEVLLDHGAQLECTDNEGNTPLYRSILHDQLREMEFLLEKGAIVNGLFHVAHDVVGESCLSTAVQLGNKSMVDLLLKHGADLSSPPGIMFFAVADSDVDMTRVLIEAGEDLFQIDPLTEYSLCDTAFAIAVSSERDLLDSQGKSHQSPWPEGLQSQVDRRTWRQHQHKIEIIQYLLLKGANPPSSHQMRHACRDRSFLTVFLVYKLCLDLARPLEWSMVSCFFDMDKGSLMPAFPSSGALLSDLIRRNRSSSHWQRQSEGTLLRYLDAIAGRVGDDYQVPRLQDLAISMLRRSLSPADRFIESVVEDLVLPRGLKRMTALTDINELFELALEQFKSGRF